jgi:hypothetical protein
MSEELPMFVLYLDPLGLSAPPRVYPSLHEGNSRAAITTSSFPSIANAAKKNQNIRNDLKKPEKKKKKKKSDSHVKRVLATLMKWISLLA